MRTISVPAGSQGSARLAPKRLLALRGDDHLVEQIRRGNEAAFEVAFERFGEPLLSFCRHMLGSPEEAEDAVQHTFAAAYRDLLRDARAIKLRPWLYTIARNRCLSILRARRETTDEEVHAATAGLDEQVERRAELRELVQDLQDLPDEQREALLLAEVGDLSHPEVAAVLGCEVPKVKALVFRARSGLLERRRARETRCSEIQEQLANLRGGALRRSGLRHHLRACPGCRSFAREVRRQRQLMAAILPVTPSLGLKSGVLAAVGIGGASAGGGAAGLGLSAAGLSSTVAKLGAVALLAGGGIAGSEAVIGDRSPDGASNPVRDRGGEARDLGASGRAGSSGSGAEAPWRAGAPHAGKRKASRRSMGNRVPPGRGAIPNGRGERGARGRGRKPARHAPIGTPPNASPQARGRGIPNVAPPAVPPVRRRGDDVRATPLPSARGVVGGGKARRRHAGEGDQAE